MLSTCIFLILTAVAITAATSILQHHANVNNDILMKLVERLDRQEKEIESLKRLEFEVAKVRQENKQLRSDIVNIQLKLEAQTVSTAAKYATNLHGGSHFISKSQTQQESSVRSGRSECKQGPQGPPGRDGRDGKDGKDGKDGRDGIQQPVITLDSVKEFMRLFGYKTPLKANIGNSSGISPQGPQGLSGGFMGGDGKGGIQGPSGAKVNPGPLTLNSLKPTLELEMALHKQVHQPLPAMVGQCIHVGAEQLVLLIHSFYTKVWQEEPLTTMKYMAAPICVCHRYQNGGGTWMADSTPALTYTVWSTKLDTQMKTSLTVKVSITMMPLVLYATLKHVPVT
ncbi:uncharacterized protein LOC106173894 [Lingula anatina]|uniref:Uncharacterized protein LOC106173894 n=1 Tax=Lingula anatina TaxID=7574 RepID=A0A1S3JJX5_LINAN|nr:uncharacterized protein LOC106173894 [Lingula anatina]|eukprot:XP_013410673.1 uncharacterized protein LOC106173894 [Lingula anatina]